MASPENQFTHATSPVPIAGDLLLDSLTGDYKAGGALGTGAILSYSFPWSNSGAAVWATDPSYSSLNEPATGFGLDQMQQTAFRAALATWSQVANIQFVEVADTPTSVGEIRVAWTQLPNPASDAWTWQSEDYWASASDIWLSDVLMGGQPDTDWQAGGFNYTALIHEIGHALWLEHPFEGTAPLPAAYDSNQYTVMSYTDHPHHLFVQYHPAILKPDGSWTVSWDVVPVSPSTPMLLDIAALQSVYGANMTWHTGDDTYSFDPAHPFIMTLWDAGGIDTISASNFQTDCRIDLREGHFSTLPILPDPSITGLAEPPLVPPLPTDYDGTDNLAIAWGAVFENAMGGNGNDLLTGNDQDNRLEGGRGADTLMGGAGHDTLAPGLGNDSVDGGAGTDTVLLPMFPNVFNLSERTPGQVSGSYAGYSLNLNDVEFVQFGRPPSTEDPERFQTTLALGELVAGAAQLQLGRLTDLYLAFFGRAPDVGGLEYWQERLLEEGRDFATISRDFAWSTEAQALFPATGSNRDFVQTVYVNSFGRQPDASGWDYWTGRLDGLGVTDLNDRGVFVGEVILGAYAPSSGEEDRALLTHRHDAALYYVNKLAVDPAEGFDAAINALLARVTGNATTEDKAEAVIDYVFANPITLTGIMGNAALLDLIWGT